MTLLFLHYEASGGSEPYLLKLEASCGPNRFEGLVRPPVTVQPPKGYSEQDLARTGLEIRMIVPWVAQVAKTCRTVVVYDAKSFLRLMDCEMQRLGKSEWIRPGIEIIDLSEKATPLARIDADTGFKKPTFEEACMLILNQNANGLASIKSLYDHEEIKQMLEVA